MTPRYKQLKISQEILLAMCRDGFPGGIVCKNPLPKDTKIVHSAIDEARRIVLTLHSASFPVWDLLSPLPELESPMIRQVKS